MFKKLFGKKEESIRQLSDPKDLKVGDMLELVDSFGLPKELRGKTFQVMEINTYEYQHEKVTEFLLEGPEQLPVHMSVENEDGEKWINFTMKLDREEVEELFDMDAFGAVFDEGVSRMPVEVVGDASDYERWLGKSYRQQGEWNSGYFYQQDKRNQTRNQYEEDGSEPFESVSLASDDDMFSLDIEVWEDGTTDVFVGISRPVADIKGLYGKT